MRILSMSSCYPSSVRPTEGIFVHRRLLALSRSVEVQVAHPLAACPILGPLGNRKHLPASETVDALTVYHPRFAYLPGVLKRFDGYFYGHGLLGWLREYVRSHPVDLLDVHFEWPDGVGAAYLARRLGLPFVLTMRGSINSRYPFACFRDRMGQALRQAAAVISVSKPMAQMALQLGARPEKVHVIPNGIDATQFPLLPRPQARESLGLGPQGPLLVCVGSLDAVKGHQDLLRAFSQLPDGATRLIVIGREMDGGDFLTALRALARHLKIDGRVDYVGPKSAADVATYFNAADVSVLASHNEGCPNVVLESLACGTPVAATGVGGIPDVVRPGVNGELAWPHDPASLAKAMLNALNRTWDRQAIQATVSSRTWDTVAQEVLQVFQSV